ncbi:uncharacterized protein [Lepidochelys kempii]|uniref:uncharacterized protein n=1 Tax=Lepidochelys kempii TaxID=8472 RepID=UPI003C6F2666
MHQPWLPSLQPSRCGDHPACAGEASLAAHAPSPAAFDVPSGGWPPPPAALAAGKRPRQQPSSRAEEEPSHRPSAVHRQPATARLLLPEQESHCCCHQETTPAAFHCLKCYSDEHNTETCCFYEELHAILGGDPTTTPKPSGDTSQEPLATLSNNEEKDIGEEEENVRQASGGSILPDSQELFLTLEPTPSQDQLEAERDAGEGTSAETLSIGTFSTPGQIRRWKKKTLEDMFNELMHSSKSDKMELRAWRITLSENLDLDRTACREKERVTQEEMLRSMKEQSDMLRHLAEVQERQLDAKVPLQPMPS